MRTQPLILLLLAALTACDEESDDTGGEAFVPSTGSVYACAGGAAMPDPYAAEDYSSLWDEGISGTVVSDEALSGAFDSPLECYGVGQRVLTIEDGDGGEWAFAYGVTDPDDADVTPAMAVSAGEAVSVRYRAVLDFGSANGFVVTSAADDRVIAAVEAGTWGGALQDGDVPGLMVSRGEVFGEEPTDCGPVVHERLEFFAPTDGDVIELEPYAVSTVTLGGAPISVYAAVSATFDDRVQCTDLAGTVSWALFR